MDANGQASSASAKKAPTSQTFVALVFDRLFVFDLLATLASSDRLLAYQTLACRPLAYKCREISAANFHGHNLRLLLAAL
jgi:hypothetical protein